MRQSPFTAVYDACVLYPAPLRDLMWLGLSGRFRAGWSLQIHDEWKRNLLVNRPDLTVAHHHEGHGVTPPDQGDVHHSLCTFLQRRRDTVPGG